MFYYLSLTTFSDGAMKQDHFLSLQTLNDNPSQDLSVKTFSHGLFVFCPNV